MKSSLVSGSRTLGIAGLVLFGVLFAPSRNSHAQATSPEKGVKEWAAERVHIGDVPILVPIPPAHVGGERVPPIARLSNNPRNELLAVFVRYVDAVVAARGVPTTFKTVYRVEVLKRAIGVKVTREELEQLKRDIRSGFVERHADSMMKEANKRNETLTKTELSKYLGQKLNHVSVGKPESLGMYDDGPDWVGIAMLMKVNFETSERNSVGYGISTVNTILVRDRMLTAIVMRLYEEDGDLDRIVDDSKEWIRRIVRANSGPPLR